MRLPITRPGHWSVTGAPLARGALLMQGNVGTKLLSHSMPRAMLVADAAWVVNEVHSALALGGWDIEEVSDPRQVTDLIRQRRPDAVIVDLQVGSMGGMAIVRAIRQGTDETGRPRTVLLLDRSADDFIARRSGADARVLKPITASALRAALSPEPVLVGADEEE